MVLRRLGLPFALSLALAACLGRAASGEDTGGAGAAGMATTASGGARTIPHPSEREKELLAPLGTDDATIDATSGKELMALGRSIGLAKAYVLCRCGLSPEKTPEDPGRVELCAAAETDVSVLGRPGTPRVCLEEGLGAVPGFEDYVRCMTKHYRDDGNAIQRACTNLLDYEPLSARCEPSKEVETLISRCW